MPERPPEDQTDWLGRLDDLFEHRVRLAIGVLLSRHDRLAFARLKTLLGETDGNLGAHLRKLEDAGYVAIRKEFRERRPVTWYNLTAKGRKALVEHLDALAAILKTSGRPRP